MNRRLQEQSLLADRTSLILERLAERLVEDTIDGALENTASDPRALLTPSSSSSSAAGAGAALTLTDDSRGDREEESKDGAEDGRKSISGSSSRSSRSSSSQKAGARNASSLWNLDEATSTRALTAALGLEGAIRLWRAEERVRTLEVENACLSARLQAAVDKIDEVSNDSAALEQTVTLKSRQIASVREEQAVLISSLREAVSEEVRKREAEMKRAKEEREVMVSQLRAMVDQLSAENAELRARTSHNISTNSSSSSSSSGVLRGSFLSPNHRIISSSSPEDLP